MTYTLNISFSPEDLQEMQMRNERVALVKVSHDPHPPLVWATFQPFQHNTVQWEEEHEVYASFNPVVPQNQMQVMTQQHAVAQSRYVFSWNHFMGPLPQVAQPTGTYQIENGAPSHTATVGLAQNININHTVFVDRPINAVTIAEKVVSFTPTAEVLVFVAPMVQSGHLHSSHMWNATRIQLKFNPTQSIQWNATNGTFDQI